MDSFVIGCCSVLLFIAFAVYRSRSRKLPPGPWGLPLIGHLHLLMGKLPHEALHSISQKFGPIVHLRLGMLPAIVVSSPNLAKEVFTKHDANFSSRPYSVVGDYVEYGFVGLGSSPYAEFYRDIRKLCATELFTSRSIDSFSWAREEAVSYVFKVVHGCHNRNEAVDLRSCISVSTFNAITQMVCSKRYFNYESDLAKNDSDPEAVEFKDLTEQISYLLIKPCLSNFVPWYLRWLDWQIPYYKQIQAKADKFLQKIVDEHKATSRECKDFVDILLNHFGQDTKADMYTKAMLVDMLTGGTDTSAVTSEWVLAAVMHNPRVMKKVQDELDNVVGPSGMVKESDLPKLNYFHAVIKETMRRYPTASIIPRISSHDTEVGGNFVPKGTTLIVNSWAIGMDASSWKDSNEFIPERFLGSSIDYKGQDFELLPFGSGRRKCPGMALGVRTVELLVANLLHGFDWKFETATPPPMEAIFSTMCMLKTPLRAIATPRLLPATN